MRESWVLLVQVSARPVKDISGSLHSELMKIL